jgi:hypothetical protein
VATALPHGTNLCGPSTLSHNDLECQIKIEA